MRTTADERLGSAGLAAIDTAAEAAVTGLTTQDAYPVLRAHLALCAVAGRDPAGGTAGGAGFSTWAGRRT
jgi:hypothetical protein